MASLVRQRTAAVRQSPEDGRQHRALLLNNRLRVLLVSDPLTDKSAAAMTVQVGHLSDPEDVQGLAHFCEHMLFMGTTKYPDENDYQKFLNDQGGSGNAYTSTDETNYHFDVAPAHFRDALDRFAQFFISPLFGESSTERETNAVHSEHEKNVAADSWRLMQVERITCRSGHPHTKFGTGNRETLSVPDVRERLLQFHRQWYSSNIMSLVLVGKESLDELETTAVELFSAVEDKDVEAPTWPEHPCGPEQVVLSLLVAAAAAAPAEIFSYDTGDHSHTASGEAGTAVTGIYSLETPEGKTITVTYTADKDGYRAESDALPVAPEVPDVPAVPAVPVVAEVAEAKAAAEEPAPAAEVKAAAEEPAPAAEVKAAAEDPAPAAEVKAAAEEPAPAAPAEEEAAVPTLPVLYHGVPLTYAAYPTVYNALDLPHTAITYSVPITYTGAKFAFNTGSLQLAHPITYIH